MRLAVAEVMMGLAAIEGECQSHISDSSNGRKADSESASRGSNP